MVLVFRKYSYLFNVFNKQLLKTIEHHRWRKKSGEMCTFPLVLTKKIWKKKIWGEKKKKKSPPDYTGKKKGGLTGPSTNQESNP